MWFMSNWARSVKNELPWQQVKIFSQSLTSLPSNKFQSHLLLVRNILARIWVQHWELKHRIKNKTLSICYIAKICSIEIKFDRFGGRGGIERTLNKLKDAE
jgi:hypothetical protein